MGHLHRAKPKKEQVKQAASKKLREEYVAAVRRNLRSQLNRIDMVNEDGSVENLGEKYDGKRPN